MSKIAELEPAFTEWLAECPACIQALATRLPPDRLYRMKSTQQRVYIIGYSEDDTLRVAITGEYNLIDFEREVFGVAADDLEECELPTDDEPLGVTQTAAESLTMINTLRALNGLEPLNEL